MSDLTRDGGPSLTQQIVDAVAEAIASAELKPGDRLPTTRALAELAGVNHLTAARAYRRLADLGLVAGRVGSGTYVRATAPSAADAEVADGDTSWQLYALPEERITSGDMVLREMMRAAESGEGIPLSVGYPSPKLFPVERIAELAAGAMAEEGPRALQYATAEGLPELREEIAALCARRGLAESADEIAVTTGARQALTLASRAILEPGDAVACESPSFFGLIEALRDTGARVLPVPSDEDGLDTGALEGLLRRHEIRLLALQPRLQNPTGRDLVPERRRHLLELARRHGFFVLEDGIYASLRFEGEALPALRAEAPEHVIYVDSLSKTVSGGLRIGWVAATGPVLDRILREKRLDDIHSSTLPQMIAARFLAAGDYESHLERAIPFHRERCDALLGAIERELGPLVSVARPLGGGHLWLTLTERIDERDLADEAAREGVSFVPGGAMMPERPRHTHMRVTFSFLDPDELVEGARRLGRAVRAARRRAGRPSRAALPVA